ncbi:MAG: hypothetical protein ACI8TQ_002963 [Planctomycetota bacterium]|jgi:hypothetical protein
MRKSNLGASVRSHRSNQRGSVLVVTLVAVSALSIFGLALLMTGLSGTRTLNQHDDDYRLSSAVESVAILSADNLWAGYWASAIATGGNPANGTPGSIVNFRAYLDSLGVANNGIGDPPGATEGQDMLNAVGLPAGGGGDLDFNNVSIDSIQVYRRDVDAESTQLYLTVSASTNRGKGIVNPVLNRAVQQVYTVEPSLFDGLEYGILANNVNCIFCHTQIDSTERFFGSDPTAAYDKVKVGTLETLMLRHNMDGNSWAVNDFDSDSVVAGSIYVRGAATDHEGIPFATSDWNSLSMGSFDFDSQGQVIPDSWGEVSINKFSPAGATPSAGENLYLNYSSNFSEMVDGALPTSFPAPIPDNGGIDPATGTPAYPAGIGNKIVDDEEFDAAVAKLKGGKLLSGLINVSSSASPITTLPDYAAALTAGNLNTVTDLASGNMILRGTQNNPIHIDGDVAIDGDLIITGVVEGEGTLTVRGNVYIPTDIVYADGVDANGNRTFGEGANGKNLLAIVAGGNVMIGDYLRPMSLFGASSGFISGTDTAQGSGTDDWSFSLAEISLFNRTEWMKTQPLLPGPSDDNTDPLTWTAANPHYISPAQNGGTTYKPRFYAYGTGDKIPMYNKGGLYYDTTADTWLGDFEVPLDWESSDLTYITPAAGEVVSQISPNDEWISEDMYKLSLDYFMNSRPYGAPLEIDSLIYTNNAVFGIVNRSTTMVGQLQVNGAIVCADLGLLSPGAKYTAGAGTASNVPGSNYLIGLQLNYDPRINKDDLVTIPNPNKVEIKRTLWNPTSNVL